ncbi:MAG: phospholipase/Carboxylesterase, partial [Thermoleophilia bacterium]|nr:phospholipase/Carboxylesterase [Thermoleophilia bacterium]
EAPYVPQGQFGHHWYVVRRVGYPDIETFSTSLELLHRDVDALLGEFDLGHDRLVIGGFSQGAVMSIATALGEGRTRPAGVIAFSGFVPIVEGWQLAPEAAADTPVVLAHGSLDPVITIDFGHDAKQRLEAAGARVEYVEAPFGHEISAEALHRARELVDAAVPTRV